MIKLNLTQPILNIEDKPLFKTIQGIVVNERLQIVRDQDNNPLFREIEDPRQEHTLREELLMGLLTNSKIEQKDSFRAYKLGRKVKEAKSTLKVEDVEDIDFIIKCYDLLGRMPLIYGQVKTMLEESKLKD